MLSPALLLTTALFAKDEVTIKLIPSGAVARSGGYRPIPAALSAETTAKKPTGLTAPQYGTIEAGTKKFAFAVDQVEGKEPVLIIDLNGDGNLTNDKPTPFTVQPNGNAKIYRGEATINIGKDVPVSISFYRFDPADPARAAQSKNLFYYFDYGYEVNFSLDGKPFTSFVAGEVTDKTVLAVDRNGDGKISYKRENIRVGVPFNYTGTTYKFVPSTNGVSLETVAEKLPVAPLPPNLAIGSKAIGFESPLLDGGKISFPNDYKGKLVMIDFWATWCGPCIAELPNVKAAYQKWKDQGFDVLSISFDQADKAQAVKDFAVKNEMPWKHIYEGKYWDTTLGGEYDVSGIPFCLLVDGDTGKILGDSRNLRGPKIVEFIGEQLAKKKAGQL